MAKKNQPKMVHCRYPKCKFLHETTELLKDDAVKGGSKNSYYHPDCWHTMQTINQIRDTFVKEVNPMLTGQQIGQLVSIVNHMVFSKGISVEYIKFALEYYIKYKSGALKYPGGISYIVQNRDVEAAWKKQQEHIIREAINKEIKERQEINNDPVDDIGGLLSTENTFVYKPQKSRSFADILG